MDHQALVKTFLVPITSPQHMHDWVHNYLGLDLPVNTVDPDSNSSPIKWLFEAYNLIRENKTAEVPGLIVYAPREGYKTLTTSILEVLVAVHFMMPVAHMAAIEKQSSKSVYYVNNFCRKLKPFLDAHDINIHASNKRSVAFEDKNNNSSYINIIICTLQGANSEHTTLFVVDEVDVVRFPNAYEEAKLIPGVMNGVLPLTILTSTRKFAFGMMQKEIDNAHISKNKILHWNVIDVTEKCPASRHKPELPKEERMVHPRLPLRNISVKEWSEIQDSDKTKSEFEKLDAYAGCAKCPILPVCKMRLAHRPEEDTKGLFKPIDFTIRQFSQISPEMGEAQLMCWKPSTTGLIYGRFDDNDNILTIAQAYTAFTGEPAPRDISLRDLVNTLQLKGIKFYASVDWGHAHAFAITVSCKAPNGEWWLIDTFAQTGMEFEDIMKLGEEVRDEYRMSKVWPDPSQPMMVKAFRKRRIPCRSFDPDVKGGIEAVRAQIVDAYGRRRLKVIRHERNEFLIKGFHNHHFVVDAQGNVTDKPDDEEFADVMDTVRYQAQCLFGIGISKHKDTPKRYTEVPGMEVTPHIKQEYEDWMTQKIQNMTQVVPGQQGKSSSGTILWDFTDPDPEGDGDPNL